jgi:hypothetical protein
MIKKRRCKYCRRIFLITRNPGQNYCSQPDCQRVRKNQWRKNARHNDIDYRNNQHHAHCRWKAHNPHYWKQYRASHQEYVHRNREQQRMRDRNAKTGGHAKAVDTQAAHLAKSDALFEKNPLHSGIYQLIPMLGNNLAKSDALFVKIDLITTDYDKLCLHS